MSPDEVVLSIQTIHNQKPNFSSRNLGILVDIFLAAILLASIGFFFLFFFF